VADLAIAVLAMAIVVVASNFLVQFPVEHVAGGINLADTLTWGAFTYPIAFLVTDLTNRRFGPSAARKVVLTGFVIAIVVPMVFWRSTKPSPPPGSSSPQAPRFLSPSCST
jgi:uncharacterized integral membrane protein (TIGR00697 family)